MKVPVVVAMLAALVAAGVAEGKTLYLKNGDEIDYHSLSRKNGKISVFVNRQTHISFDEKEVDLPRTMREAGVREKTKGAQKTQKKWKHVSQGKRRQGAYVGAVVPPGATVKKKR